jgi:hypothetical protein
MALLSLFTDLCICYIVTIHSRMLKEQGWGSLQWPEVCTFLIKICYLLFPLPKFESAHSHRQYDGLMSLLFVL